uniref:Uncharacterized protein n=1 Tax=Ficus carica TaxID=3494 RepID=A0AA88JFP1_FICCA|nr:hypothetical protein TIFTF001_055471 [Ficus carica]GMN70814.1 hypothetical protein TIFTF001_055474 [Ficus carica]
MLTGFPSGPA